MPDIDRVVSEMRRNTRGVRFVDLLHVCEHYFGPPRIHGSHFIFHKPWPGDPLINIQRDTNGKAKPYQVRQVLAGIRELEKFLGGRHA